MSFNVTSNLTKLMCRALFTSCNQCESSAMDSLNSSGSLVVIELTPTHYRPFGHFMQVRSDEPEWWYVSIYLKGELSTLSFQMFTSPRKLAASWFFAMTTIYILVNDWNLLAWLYNVNITWDDNYNSKKYIRVLYILNCNNAKKLKI